MPAERQRPSLSEDFLDDFLERVRHLPPTSVEHIPLQFRSAFCKITIGCLHGMLDGDGACAALEEARSKLLLSPAPKGRSLRTELKCRLSMWRSSNFEELLGYIEEQHRQRQISGRLRRRVGRSVAARCQKLARNGAYSKSVSAATSEMATCSADDERHWAEILLPSSSRPDASHSSPHPADDEAEDNAKFRHSLSGVRFAALSAPGPSGCRPEHVKEMLSMRQRSLVNNLLRVIGTLREKGQKGSLPPCARWILASRLVYLKKKVGPKPRPIRVGEFWRRVIAKGLSSDCRDVLQKLMLNLCQFGVAMPNGSEVLIHFRSVAERIIRQGGSGAVAVIDVDFVNCYSTLEWDSIRTAVAEHIPSLAAWTEWCHVGPVPVYLPSGGVHMVDRGAEQGDPLGNVFCALVLAGVAQRAKLRVQTQLANPDDNPGFLDAWYIDDGQLFCRPELVDTCLHALDAEAALVGAKRGTGVDVKSKVRILGSDSDVERIGDDWATDYVRETCAVQPPNANVEVLGALITDSEPHLTSHFNKTAAAAGLTQGAIHSIGDVATELVLTRRCADVCKVTHLLRASGPSIAAEALTSYDAQLKHSLEAVLGSPLDDESFLQASAGVQEGGLGFRQAHGLAHLCFVASRVECRAAAVALASSFSQSGLIPETFADLFDGEVAVALGKLLQDFPVTARARAEQLVADAKLEATHRFNMAMGRAPAVPAGHTTDEAPARELLVHPAGGEDPEYETSASNLQRALCKVVDELRLDTLSERLLQAARWGDARRVRELRDPSVSHDWIWSLNPAYGAWMPPEDYITCIKLRMGVAIIDEPIACPKCGNAILNRSCSHALSCIGALGESTRGHNRSRDSLLNLVHLADSSAETEVSGLIPDAPTLRPADIFTSAALPGCQAALDIGIMSPDATGAGADCCEAMFQRKLGTYESYLPQLEAQGIQYKPVVFSCYGRLHPEAASIIEAVSKQAARRRGFGDHRLLLRRAHAAIGVQIWRRAAAMIRICLPRLTPEGASLMFGADPTSDGAVETLEQVHGEDLPTEYEPAAAPHSLVRGDGAYGLAA